MKRAVVLLALFVSCMATAIAQPAPATQNPLALAKQVALKQVPVTQSGKCIGVISHLGDNFMVKKVGIVVFQNEETDVPIGSWHIDDLVVAKIGGFLNKRAAVRNISYSKGAFASLDSPKLFRDYDAELGQIVRAVAAGARCTRYVVVTRGGSAYGTTNQTLAGLGIVSSGGLGLQGPINLYTLIELRVYNGETFALVTRKTASIGQPTLLAMIRGPHREVDRSFWPDSSDVAQNGKLRQAIRELVGQSMDLTLPEMQLTE
jgi:hypothetical protein